MTDRRKFLELLGSTSMFAAAGVPSHIAGLRGANDAHPAPLDTTWDMAWADRVQGKFRAVFDSPAISDGAALFRAIMWCDQYKAVYGNERGDMSPVIVFRHMAIPLIMNDAYWKRFKVGKETKMKTAGKWAETNPVRTTPAGMPPQWANYNLEHFLSDGGVVLACNLAFGQVVAQFKAADKLENAAADARAREHVVPGVILQPSGIFAVLRAQEAGCKYVLAS